MEIKISGYKNVESFNEHFDDGKINFVSGRSGSGKTAIGEALLQKDYEHNKKVGFAGPVSALIDGAVSTDKKITLFNHDSSDKYFKGMTSVDPNGQSPIYNVLIDDDGIIASAKAQVESNLTQIKSFWPSIEQAEQEFSVIEKQFSCKTVLKKGKLSFAQKTFALKKYENSLKAATKRSVKKDVLLMSPSLVGWIGAGKAFIANNRCPFCNKKLSSTRNKKINEIANYDEKTLSAFKLDPLISAKYNISPIQATLESINEMKKQLLDIEIASAELQSIKQFMTKAEDFEFMSNPTDFNIKADHLVSYLPGLSPIISSLETSSKGLAEAIDKVKNETKKYLKNRKKEINDFITKLSIPYIFDAKYKDGKIDLYRLVHNDEMRGLRPLTKEWNDKFKNGTNRSDALSNGEKNALALIFFLEAAKKEDPDLVIIDDPASDFDDGKRQIILDSIKKILPNKTTIVMSHDCIYEKLALAKKEFYPGRITYCQNENGHLFLTDVSKSDFGSFSQFSKDQVQRYHSTDYLRTVMNMRLHYESVGYTRRHVYKYLSGILHSVNNSSIDVEKEIEKNGWNEQTIVKGINKYFNIKDFPPYSKATTRQKTSDYSIFEKAMYLRELVPGGDKLRSELSSLVHLNNTLTIGLNPYRYDFSSQEVRDAIRSHGI
jgi:ABC-type lipoprotein export system ATPase subunit